MQKPSRATKRIVQAQHGCIVGIGHDPYHHRYTVEISRDWDNPRSRIISLDPRQFDLLARVVADVNHDRIRDEAQRRVAAMFAAVEEVAS